MDFVSSNILLPIGGVLIVVFVGWYLGKQKFFEEVTNEGELKKLCILKLFRGKVSILIPIKFIIGFIYIIIKYLAPVAIAIVFISGLIK